MRQSSDGDIHTRLVLFNPLRLHTRGIADRCVSTSISVLRRASPHRGQRRLRFRRPTHGARVRDRPRLRLRLHHHHHHHLLLQ